MELLTIKHSEGDQAVSSYDVITVFRTSREEDGITNIQTVRNMEQCRFVSFIEYF